MAGLPRRRVLLISALGILGAALGTARALAAPTVACTRVGQRTVAAGYEYTCVRVRGELRWRRTGRVTASPSSSPSSPTPSTTPTTSGSPTAAPAPSNALVRVAAVGQVPLIGAAVVPVSVGRGPDVEVVVTRDGGRIRAFDARCTHAGCVVAPAGTLLRCWCHDSLFDGSTGARLAGPAPSGLAEYATQIENGQVFARGV